MLLTVALMPSRCRVFAECLGVVQEGTTDHAPCRDAPASYEIRTGMNKRNDDKDGYAELSCCVDEDGT
jgi:hypothetical protein